MESKICPLKFVGRDDQDWVPRDCSCHQRDCAWWVEQGTRSDGTLAGCCAVLAISSILQTLEENYSRQVF